MNEEQKMMMGKKTFETIRKVLIDNEFKFSTDEENLVFETGATGEDLPMRMLIIVEPEAERVQIRIPMQFSCPKEKLAECAILTCYASNRLALGQYNLNVLNGDITYVNIIYYAGSLIASEQYFNMIIGSFKAADIYNDKYMMVINNMMNVVDVIEKLEDSKDDKKNIADAMDAEELALKKLIEMYKETKSEKVLDKIYTMNVNLVGKVSEDGASPASDEQGMICFCSKVEAALFIKANESSLGEGTGMFGAPINKLIEEGPLHFILDEFVLPHK